MPVFVSLVRVTEKGKETIRDVGGRYESVKKWVEEAGGKVLSTYVVFGQYDYVMVSEFPTEKEAVRALTKVVSRGTLGLETMYAMPIEEFIKIARESKE